MAVRQGYWAELRARRKAFGLCPSCALPKAPDRGCVRCTAAMRLLRQKMSKEQRTKQYEANRWYWSAYKFGVTADQYRTLYRSQAGVCAICKRPGRGQDTRHRWLAVDHDHETGQI